MTADKKTLCWFRDQIIKNDPHVTELAVQFVCRDTEGQSYNRVRASLYLKLAAIFLRQSQHEELTQCILHRLLTDKFSVQFKDQLKFIIRTNPQWVREEVKKGLLSEKEYVRRYSAWLDSKLEAINNKY